MDYILISLFLLSILFFICIYFYYPKLNEYLKKNIYQKENIMRIKNEMKTLDKEFVKLIEQKKELEITVFSKMEKIAKEYLNIPYDFAKKLIYIYGIPLFYKTIDPFTKMR